MGSKSIVRLLVVLAIVGAIALIVKLTGPGTVETVSGSGIDREKVFEDFPINDVAKVRIKTADAEVNMEKGAKAWQLAERDGHPANIEAIVRLLRGVWDLKVVQIPEMGPSQFSRLELIDPDKGAEGETATVLSFQDADGKELKSLWLGKVYERSAERPGPMGGSGKTGVGRYVKTGDEDTVFLVGEPFSNAITDPSEWLNKDFFKVENLKSISIDTGKPEDDWKLSREDLVADFKLEGAKATEELDITKVSTMKTAFSGPRFEDVAVGDEAKTNQPEAITFKIETLDGFSYTVKVSEKNDLNELYLTYQVDGKFDEKRKVGEEESDEEKEKLNTEFNNTLKRLQDKLAAEKALAGKIYKVRSYVIDSINKKRAELLKESEEVVPGVKNIPGVTAPGGPGAGMPFPGGLPAGLVPPTTPPAPKPKPAAKPDAKPAPKPDAKPAAKPNAKPEPKPDAKPAVKPDAKPAAKPDAKPAAKLDAKPAAKPDAKPAAKPDAKPAAKPDAKPEPKPDAKPAAKPDAKPEPKPDAKPSEG